MLSVSVKNRQRHKALWLVCTCFVSVAVDRVSREIISPRLRARTDHVQCTIQMIGQSVSLVAVMSTARCSKSVQCPVGLSLGDPVNAWCCE